MTDQELTEAIITVTNEVALAIELEEDDYALYLQSELNTLYTY